MKKAFVLLMSIAAFLITGCGQSVDIEAEKAAVLAADTALMKAYNDKDTELVMSFYTDDFRQGIAGATGFRDKERCRELNVTWFEQGWQWNWNTETVEVSSSGDLAYTFSIFDFFRINEEGTEVHNRGGGVFVWKKQDDGSWKIVLGK
ncbi:YybH family protein [candidate division KSB1 bacterium]